MKVVVMGLGLHGGGLESARYLLRHGADLTVTDLRDEQTLAPSIEQLEAAGGRAASVRYVLGRHELEDFKNADMVVKNPGVRPDSPFLQASKCIETDISLFLAASPARLLAVTGSKGKSATASALHWVLSKTNAKAWLGGNITVSPLSFLEELQEGDDVVLELSSWQLGDLKGREGPHGPLLKPKAAVITSIMPDHQDRYGSMEAYVADKRVIYQGQDKDDIIVAGEDKWGRSFHNESRARSLVYGYSLLPNMVSGGWLTGPESPGFGRLCGPHWPGSGETAKLAPAHLRVPGYHQKTNLLAAGLALFGLGVDAETIHDAFGDFPGIEHRLELFYETRGVSFYNDSAATIPEAAAAAIEALGRDAPLVLVAGGTDKNLDFSSLVQAAPLAKAIILLAGSGGDKLCALFDEAGISCRGPFDSVDGAVQAALEMVVPGDRVALSPGCTSFGMFQNEFDRGRKWKEAVTRLA